MFEARMQAYIEMIEHALDRYVPEDRRPAPSVLHEAMRYSLLDGGKRLRPVLLLEFCRASGGDPAHALPFACALEMIHTYSLIHDDLPCMDNDDLRRGRPTSHRRFGEAQAVLAGDGLLNRAYEIMLEAGTLPADRALRAAQTVAARAGMYGMVGGQAIDVISDGRLPDIEGLTRMYAMKTGALIIAGARAGCIAAGAPAAMCDAAEQYAANIGLAFQIQDDVLDVEGDEKLLGKAVSHDAATGKTTFPALLGIEHCKAMVDELTQAAKEALAPFDNREFLCMLADQLAKRDY